MVIRVAEESFQCTSDFWRRGVSNYALAQGYCAWVFSDKLVDQWDDRRLDSLHSGGLAEGHLKVGHNVSILTLEGGTETEW